MSTLPRHPTKNTSLDPSKSTSSPVSSISSVPAPSPTSSGPIPLFTESLEQVTTGPRVITPREPSLLTLCSMFWGNRRRTLTLSKVSSSYTVSSNHSAPHYDWRMFQPLVVVPVPVLVLSFSARSGKNILTECSLPSQSSHPPRSLRRSSNLTTLSCQHTTWLKTVTLPAVST